MDNDVISDDDDDHCGIASITQKPSPIKRKPSPLSMAVNVITSESCSDSSSTSSLASLLNPYTDTDDEYSKEPSRKKRRVGDEGSKSGRSIDKSKRPPPLPLDVHSANSGSSSRQILPPPSAGLSGLRSAAIESPVIAAFPFHRADKSARDAVSVYTNIFDTNEANIISCMMRIVIHSTRTTST